MTIIADYESLINRDSEKYYGLNPVEQMDCHIIRAFKSNSMNEWLICCNKYKVDAFMLKEYCRKLMANEVYMARIDLYNEIFRRIETYGFKLNLEYKKERDLKKEGKL